MACPRTKAMRVVPESEVILKKIAAERYTNGLDKKMLPTWRVLEATLNIPNVREILKRSTIKDVKR